MKTSASRAFSKSAKRGLDSLSGADLKGKNVLVRVDFNVPLDKKTGKISDDTRIRASMPTLEFLRGKGAKIIVATHLGRPEPGENNEKYRLGPVSTRLAELLKAPVVSVTESVGPTVTKAVAGLKDGDVLLLENVRMMAGEEKNDPGYAQQLVKDSNISVYVNDAFGTAHRAHASTAGVTAFVKGPRVAGFLMQKELAYLQGAMMKPKRPFAAVIGGSKVSTKIGVLTSIINSCEKGDALIIGGGMLFTFLKAKGFSVGSSLVEDSALQLAKDIEAQALAKGMTIWLPHSVVVADKFSETANFREGNVEAGLKEGEMGIDVGAPDRAALPALLAKYKTVLWNGPLGVFEWKAGAQGTRKMADVLADLTANHGCTTVVGGGDTVAAVGMFGMEDKFSHVSTGGGASLELLEGRVLPGVAALDDAK